ncbi:MAG: PAS domain-containing sensor histidine kinase [Melioribacteraceae bacterium]
MKETVFPVKQPTQTGNLINDFSLGLVRIKNDGTPVFATEVFINLLGFQSLEELVLYTQLDERFGECFSSSKYSSFMNLNNPGEPFESRWVKKNGQSLLLREICKPAKNENGEVLFYDCVVEDITDHVIIEKLIADIKAGDYSILKALPDLIFVLTRDGKFIDYQSNFQKLFVNKFQLKGQSIRTVFPEPVSDRIMESISAALDSGGIEMFEFNLESKTETEFFEARFVIAGHDIVLMILRDISKQKHAEIQIKKFTEELKNLNATKDKFFSILSHDLRTPINGLLGYAELLSKELDSLDKEEIKHFAGNIGEIAKSTNTLLSNILDWSRIQTGRMYLHKQTMDISKSTSRIVSLLAAAASNKNIALISEVAPGTKIFADENMMQSILINLAGNAIKFTRNGGMVKIGCIEENGDFHLSVSDNGIGISKLDLVKLFDSEIIFSTNGTAKENGTGLGLLLCKEFVERHGGRIWVESIIGSGTTLHFTIPKNAQSENLSKV